MATQIDLSALVDTPIRDLLPEAAVKEILTSHPFIPIPLALNLRTISFPPHLPPNLIFRSGALSHLPPAALTQLKETYNISTIFDLRSATERKSSPSPDIPGIKTIWIPSAVDIDGSVNGQEHWRTARFNVAHADFVENNGQDGFVKMYDTVLETHREPYKTVFENLRDGVGGVLFHCTAGKDRTGVLSALILSLFEATDDLIAQDYALTRIGTEPFREVLLGKLTQQMGEDGKGLRLDTPGFLEMCSVRGPTIVAFLKSMDEKWGGEGNGVKGYLTEVIGLTEEDITKIKGKFWAGKA